VSLVDCVLIGETAPPRTAVQSSRRLRQRALGLGEGPVEPLRQYLDVARFDGRAAPDAQARRGIAIMGDVVARAFLLDRRRETLGEGRLRAL
jgi:hypothetical protein